MTAKRKAEVLGIPKRKGGIGRPPNEYAIMERAEGLLTALAGPPDDLIQPGQLAKAISTTGGWLRTAALSGRGPKATPCGDWRVYRRADVLAWLRDLVKLHKSIIAKQT